MQIKLIGLNARYTHSCLALFYLRNELEQYCTSAKIQIEQYTINDSYHNLLLHIRKSEPDYYFFSAAIWNNDLIIRLISDLLVVDEESMCIVGGPQSEIVGKAVASPRCIVVSGEIERINERFYEHLHTKELSSLYNCSSPRAGFSAPYREADFDDHLKNRHIYYESSRGCPFSCTYCLSATDRKTYHKDIKQVKEELGAILAFNPQVVRFIDRTFNDLSDRALEIWRFLAEVPCDTVFHFEVSPVGFSEQMFDFLAELPPGKFQFEIGIQSTNSSTLEAVRRRIDIQTAHNIIARLSGFDNIHLHVDLILGLPFETEESFYTSFREVFAMQPHYIQMGLLKILPDTPICHTASEYCYVYSTSAPYSVYANKWLNYREMERLYWFGECVESFVNNRYFASLWRYFRDASVDVVSFFQALHDICTRRQFFQRSPTQELLISILIECVDDWPERNYIVELLRYDWLRCGHRFLCQPLEPKDLVSSSVLKKVVYRRLAECTSSISDEVQRLNYLKNGFLSEFSNSFLKKQGYACRPGRHFFCFIQEREKTLQRYARVVRFSLPEGV